MKQLVFLVGLTAVGKTSSINALEAHDYKLLPNRRELTDLIIIPEIQKDLGQSPRTVTDRIERFELTAKYRQKHRGGIVFALQQYLQSIEPGRYIFDNIRGKNELMAAASGFEDAAFIFLHAPFAVRLQRLVGRGDSFDRVNQVFERQNLSDELESIKNAGDIFDLELLAAQGFEREKLLSAVRIITKEHQNYDSEAAKEFLFSLDKKRYIYIDTAKNNISEVKSLIERFLDGDDN